MKPEAFSEKVINGAPGKTRLTWKNHFSISAYWFATNLLWGALLVIVVPSQIRDIAAGRAAQLQGLLLGIGAIPALIIPLLVGPISDRCTSKWGRRRPYMVAGVAINLIGLMLIYTAGIQGVLWLYFVGYLVVQVGNNTATGSYSGIIPDIVPENQRGIASGWMAAMSQTGTILGVLSAGLLAKAGCIEASYAVMAVSLVIFLGITVVGVREQQRKDTPDPLELIIFIKRLWIDPRKYPDFAWVWITRALVVMGLWMVQEYLQYYVVDVLHVPDKQKEIVTAAILIISLLCATITGLVGGAISDRIGRKRVVYIANTVIAFTAVAFLFGDSVIYAVIIGSIFGLGFGAYFSVDWALGCDVLPNKEDAAKDMAIWHVAMVLPQSIAQPMAGFILGRYLVGVKAGVPHYSTSGYAVLFGLAAFFLLLGAVLLRNVRKVK